LFYCLRAGVLACRDLMPVAKLLDAVFVSRCATSTTTCISISDLAAIMGTSSSTVSRGLAQLLEHHLVEIVEPARPNVPATYAPTVGDAMPAPVPWIAERPELDLTRGLTGAISRCLRQVLRETDPDRVRMIRERADVDADDALPRGDPHRKFEVVADRVQPAYRRG